MLELAHTDQASIGSFRRDYSCLGKRNLGLLMKV